MNKAGKMNALRQKLSNFSMVSHLPFILLFIIVAVLLLDTFIPTAIKEILLAISLSLKSIIIFILPFIIFGLLFKTIVKLSSSATAFIITTLFFIILSNFASTMLSSVVGASIYHFDLHFSNPFGAQNLEPYWNFVLPKIIENDKAMFLGIGFGLVLPFMNRSLSEKIAVKLDSIVHILLKCILYIMPFFILGFIIKLKHDGIIQNMIKEYSLIFMMIAASLIMYITFLYALSARFNFSKTLQRINHMLPATMVGFSTMSSAMAMPLTILASETNAKEGGLNADMTRTVVPLTVNIHLIGDCFAIPIFAYAILKNYGMAEPEFVSYLIFAFYFVLAKFSVAAIPGGGILVMLPILEAHLGFTAPMLSLITALYILFDPIITCANVLGNGAFALLVSRKIKVRTKSLPL